MASPPPSSASLLDRLGSTAPHRPSPIDRYTFLDIGAGKGRAHPGRCRVPLPRGPWASSSTPALATVARNNIDHRHRPRSRSQFLSPIRLIEADALTLAFPKTPTLAFLFHPFEAPLLRKLLRSRRDPVRRLAPWSSTSSTSTPSTPPSLTATPPSASSGKAPIPMSTEDHIADLREIAEQLEYGSTGDEQCAIYRYTGRSKSPADTED